MVYAVVFAVLAAYLAAVAAWLGGWAWVLVWPAVAFTAVAVAYAGAGPRVFGKRPDGTLRPANHLVLLPFLLFTGSVWHLLRVVGRGPAWCELAPGLLIGRRLLPGERPAGVGLVIDLTAEFPEPRGVRTGTAYRSLPTLDAGVPDEVPFRELVEEAARFPGVVFVHCAQGHGRTGTFAAAVLLARGLAATPAGAVAAVRKARPGVRLEPAQRRLLDRAAGGC